MVSSRDISNIRQKLSQVAGTPQTITNLRQFKEEVLKRAKSADLTKREIKILENSSFNFLKKFGSVLGVQKETDKSRYKPKGLKESERELIKTGGKVTEQVKTLQKQEADKIKLINDARRGIKRSGTSLGEFQAMGGRLGGQASTIAQIQRGELKTSDPEGFISTSEGVMTQKTYEKLQNYRNEKRQNEFLKETETRLYQDQMSKRDNSPFLKNKQTPQENKEGLVSKSIGVTPKPEDLIYNTQSHYREYDKGNNKIIGVSTPYETYLSPSELEKINPNKKTYRGFEDFVSSKTTKSKVGSVIGDILGFSEKSQAKTEQQIKRDQEKLKQQQTGERKTNLFSNELLTKTDIYTHGAIAKLQYDIREKPVTGVGLMALGGVLSKVGASSVAFGSKISKTFPFLGRFFQIAPRGIGYGVGAVYLSSKGIETIQKTDLAQKGGVLGDVIFEFGAMGLGASSGKIITKYRDIKLDYKEYRFDKANTKWLRTKTGEKWVRKPTTKVFEPESVDLVKNNNINYRITGIKSEPGFNIEPLNPSAGRQLTITSERPVRNFNPYSTQFKKPITYNYLQKEIYQRINEPSPFYPKDNYVFYKSSEVPTRIEILRNNQFKLGQTKVIEYGDYSPLLDRTVYGRNYKPLNPTQLETLKAYGTLEQGKIRVNSYQREMLDYNIVNPKPQRLLTQGGEVPPTTVKKNNIFIDKKASLGRSKTYFEQENIIYEDYGKTKFGDSKGGRLKPANEIFSLNETSPDIYSKFKIAPLTPTSLNENYSKSDFNFNFGEETINNEMFKDESTYRSTNIFKSDFNQIQEQTQEQRQALTSKFKFNSVELTTQEFKPTNIFKYSELKTDKITRPKERTKPISIPFIPKFGTKIKKEVGYNVYMYEDGGKVKANMKTLPKKEANRLGRDIADNSLSASYIIKKTNSRVPSSLRSKLATGISPSPSKFRMSKSRKGFSVEKRSFRLDSWGEKSGIKASKLLAQRKSNLGINNKKKKKNIWGL